MFDYSWFKSAIDGYLKKEITKEKFIEFWLEAQAVNGLLKNKQAWIWGK